ncbi:MAG TPA: hypothetical protein VFJ61_01210 [Solirubrobacterales bacterium]|nr:hypothetical protein [Solirubrobacterales bacterium]
MAVHRGDGDGGGPLNAIAEAAVKTQQAGGGRAVMSGTVTKPGHAEPFILSGQVVYNDEGLSGGTVHLTDPKTHGPVKLEMVQDGTEMYMSSSSFGTLPQGRKWMGLDLALGADLEEAAPPATVDARGELALLEEATGGVQELGKADVRGVPTTRYRGRIDVSESAARLRELGADDTASVVEDRGAPVQLEAWIDGKGLVRRMRIVQAKAREEGEEPTVTKMQIDFFDFGLEPEIDVPDSDEVFDATSLVREQVDDE